MAKITFDDKVSLTTNVLPRKNKVIDADINEIKTSVNELYDNPVIPKLNDVLYQKNTTSGNDIIISNGDVIKDASGANKYDLQANKITGVLSLNNIGATTAVNVLASDSAGKIVDGSALVSTVPMKAYLSSNVLVNNASSPIIGLSAILKSGKKYIFEAYISSNCNAFYGLKVKLDYGGGTITAFNSHTLVYQASSIVGSNLSYGTNIATTGVGYNSANPVFYVRGYINPSSNNTFNLLVAQNTPNAANSQVIAGSYLIVTEII